MPTPQIITIGKQTYLAGLTWHSLDERPDKLDLRTEADKIAKAKKSSIDWYALRPVTPKIIQAGFSARPTDAAQRPRKLISLAATAAGILKEPWLGTYQIAPDLYWYIAVRDSHTILPDGDVIGTRAEVDEAARKHSGYADWNYVEGNLDDLIALLDKARATKGPYGKPVYIDTLYPTPIPRGVYIGTAITLALIAGGAYWFQQNEKQKAQNLARMMAAKAALAAQKPAFLAPPALLSQPMPDEWLSACRATIGPTPLAEYGWSLTLASCTDKVATIEWKRTELANAAQHPDCAPSQDGNTCTSTMPIDIQMAGPDNRGTLTDARIAFQTWAQKRYLDTQFSTDSKVAASSLPGAPKPASSADTSDEGQATFSFTLPFPPDGMQLDSIPGARITSLTFDLNKWAINGIIYGKSKP